MPPKLQVPNNFKFKIFFWWLNLRKALAPDELVSFDVPESNHIGELKSQLQNLELTTTMSYNCNIILVMFEPFENPSPIVVKNVHGFNPKKKKKKTFDTNVNCKF